MYDAALYEQPRYVDPKFPIVFHEDYMNETRLGVYANWHMGMELLRCRSGNGAILTGAETVDFGEGDLICIGSNAVHLLRLGAASECVYDCLIVEPSYLEEHGLALASARFPLVLRDDELTEAFDGLREAFRRGDEYVKPVAIARILLLFALLSRHRLPAPRDASKRDERRGRQVALVAMKYMREHVSETVRLDELSRHVGMSKFYFCRQFQAHTGITPVQHMNMLKCDRARRLMLDDGMNVSEAARCVGFQNLSYFSKLYKAYMGKLPSRER